MKSTRRHGTVGTPGAPAKPGANGGNGAAHSKGAPPPQAEAFRLKVGLAEMLKGGVIMDVMTAEQAEIAQEAGAAAVMALERIPSQIRKHGGVARMSDPSMIRKIQAAVDIPVMAKCRIGHIVEAQILEALEVDFVDESEVLTPADEANHVWKHEFKVPFVCGCRDLGEALRRIGEGAAMIRTKGEAGTGNVVEAVRHMRAVMSHIRKLTMLTADERMAEAKSLGAPFELVREVAETGRLPVPNFAAGGVATPADAALMMKLGAEAVFVGSGIFEVGDPSNTKSARADQTKMARAIVQAVTHWDRPDLLKDISTGLPAAMRGIALETLPETELLARRGW
jgi:pyridoxal 5'-phosphate synthase pdxS subunit